MIVRELVGGVAVASLLLVGFLVLVGIPSLILGGVVALIERHQDRKYREAIQARKLFRQSSQPERFGR